MPTDPYRNSAPAFGGRTFVTPDSGLDIWLTTLNSDCRSLRSVTLIALPPILKQVLHFNKKR